MTTSAVDTGLRTVRSVRTVEARGFSFPWFAALGCLCLVPNPGVFQTGNFRIQAVNLVLLLWIVLRIRSVRTRALNAWLLLCIPAVISALVCFSVQLYAVETLKLAALWMLGTSHLVAGTPRDGKDTVQLLKGISVGILLNFALGVMQVITVPRGMYPFWSWNSYGAAETSMIRGLQAGAGMFGVRVFGFFFEPSDLTASIGHWWLLIAALRLGLIKSEAFVRFSRSRLCMAALLAGAALMMLSRSGHAFIVAGGLGVLLVLALLKNTAATRIRRIPILAVLLVLPMIGVGLYDLGQRVVSAGPESLMARTAFSWDARASSIVESFRVWMDGPSRQFLFGLGYEGVYRIKVATGHNIWSVVGKSVLVFGSTAILAWLVIVFGALRSIRSSSAVVVGLVFGATFGLAILVTTSYETLVSPWLALALLLSWRYAFGSNRSQYRA